MIAAALELIRSRLDAALRQAAPRTDAWVILANLVEPDGRPFAAASGKVVMALANIGHPVHARTAPMPGPAAPPPLDLDLLVLFVVNLHGPHYAEGLTAIGRTIGFFHRTPVFNRTNAADLDPALDRLTMTPADLELPALGSVMAMHGITYLPSACYMLRLVPLAAGAGPPRV